MKKDKFVTIIIGIIAVSAWLYMIGHYGYTVMQKTNDDLYQWKLHWADRMYN